MYEIKPATDLIEGLAQLTAYIAILKAFDKAKRPWQYGFSYVPKENPLDLGGGFYALVLPTINGVIPYKVVNFRQLAGEAIVGSIVAITVIVADTVLTTSLTSASAGAIWFSARLRLTSSG